MDPSLLCQMFFSLGAIVSIGGISIPSFRQQIMTYGSRSTNQHVNPESQASAGKFERLWHYVASIQVPHSWFIHYYIVSVASSLFWVLQFYTQGPALQVLVSNSSTRAATMTTNQIILSWTLMAVQGTRRLYESIIFTRPSESRMWFGLWILGMVFYITIGISVWIEGIATIVNPGSFPTFLGISDGINLTQKTILAIPIFLMASGIQHVCHRHLANLKKYSLPNHYLFGSVVCPHYTSECLIYLSIAIIAAPRGQIFNKTVLAGFAFVISNLAVTSDATRQWYAKKFGEESVKGHWRMIPLVY